MFRFCFFFAFSPTISSFAVKPLRPKKNCAIWFQFFGEHHTFVNFSFFFALLSTNCILQIQPKSNEKYTMIKLHHQPFLWGGISLVEVKPLYVFSSRKVHLPGELLKPLHATPFCVYCFFLRRVHRGSTGSIPPPPPPTGHTVAPEARAIFSLSSQATLSGGPRPACPGCWPGTTAWPTSVSCCR